MARKRTTESNVATIDVQPAYSCGECGNIWLKEDAEGQANRCECGKMAAKATDHAFKCGSCDAIIDADTMEEVE